MGEVAMLASASKLGASIADLLAADKDAQEIDVRLDDIEIVQQVREEFEDEDSSLAELGDSLAKQQLQAIGLYRTPDGAKPFRLIFGERRVRAALLKQLPTLKAKVFDMTPQEAEEAQMAENIHRKNLTQLEEAKRLKRDLDEAGGKVEVVLAKHNKSKSWLSKRLTLLDLGPVARRLLSENITADKNVIGNINTIEKRDPVKATAAVEALKKREPKANARDIAGAAKDEVKPPKKTKDAQGGKPAAKAGGSVATARDDSQQQPGLPQVFATAPLKPHQKALRHVLDLVNVNSMPAAAAVANLSAKEAELAGAHLDKFFQEGKKTELLVKGLVDGLRAGSFSAEGEGAVALAVFVQGFSQWPQLDLAKALEVVKTA